MEKYLLKFQDIFKRDPEKHMRYITNCHNDYSPRNIFVSENSVEVIDFVGVEKGFPEQDINFFCNYIYKARFNFLYPLRVKKMMIKAFHSGYDDGQSSIEEHKYKSKSCCQ
jgi:Ser/Thr protein kinase RdoA (MazF antagonist)